MATTASIKIDAVVATKFRDLSNSSVSAIEESYASLKEDVLGFKQKGRVVLLGDFNARVGRSTDVDDVIGMFGEETCNASGNWRAGASQPSGANGAIFPL